MHRLVHCVYDKSIIERRDIVGTVMKNLVLVLLNLDELEKTKKENERKREKKCYFL